MYKNKKGFSLIEIIIATGIISISVFGTYKLIGENIKIINSSGNYFQAYSLFPTFIECLEYIGLGGFTTTVIGTKYNIYLGNDLKKCEISNSGTTLDNIDYFLNSTIINTGDDFIDWGLNINSESTRDIHLEYKQIKK